MKNITVFMLAIVVYIAGVTDSYAYRGDVAEGERLFQQRCAMCHGENGRGNNGMAADFVTEWHRLTKSDEELADHIRNGYRSGRGPYSAGQCPKHVLTDDEMDDVITFMKGEFSR